MSATLRAQRPVLRLVPQTAAPLPRQVETTSPFDLGQALLQRGLVTPLLLARATAFARAGHTSLADVLIARGWLSEREILEVRASHFQAPQIDLLTLPPDPHLIASVGPDLCLSAGLLPVRRLGGLTIVAIDDPEEFDTRCSRLPAHLETVHMVLATRGEMTRALEGALAPRLSLAAETRVPAGESARSMRPGVATALAAGLLATVALVATLWPANTFSGLLSLSVLTLFALTALKFAALIAAWKAPAAANPRPSDHRELPTVSLIIALYGEATLAAPLIARLQRLEYPPERLDVLIVTETADTATRTALAATEPPPWIRVLSVPDGPVRTKPRALNYALGFARGSIIGVYDAEDAPAPDQIHKAVAAFRQAGPNVACLQGMLDFYGARRNWLARAFAIDYAAWFRVVLPGLSRLGLVVPLGGTTLFLRRAALEEVGAWDAHNVTEDADLGLRLARHGFRTEILDTVTEEEPNARILPWIRQRARWQKGYAVTWVVAMRAPVALWCELGTLRFLGVQALFLGTLCQFALAPVLWVFWVLAIGFGPVPGPTLPPLVISAMSVLFVASTLVTLFIALLGLSRAGHRDLMPWIFTLPVYGALASVAVLRAVIEAVRRPFHWDKTTHGLIEPEPPSVEP